MQWFEIGFRPRTLSRVLAWLQYLDIRLLVLSAEPVEQQPHANEEDEVQDIGEEEWSKQ